MTNQKHYPDLGSDPSVWNFCTHFSDVIWQGNQWQRRQMQAVFSGYCLFNQLVLQLSLTFPLQDSIEQAACWDATKQHLRKECRNSILLTYLYPDLECNSLCLRQITTLRNQSETQPRSQAISRYSSMKFSSLFYGHYFMGKPAVA